MKTFPFSLYSKQTKSEKQTLKSNNVIMFLNKRDLRELKERKMKNANMIF